MRVCVYACMRVSHLLKFILPIFISRLTRPLARRVCLHRFLFYNGNFIKAMLALEIESQARFCQPFYLSRFDSNGTFLQSSPIFGTLLGNCRQRLQRAGSGCSRTSCVSFHSLLRFRWMHVNLNASHACVMSSVRGKRGRVALRSPEA